MPSLPTPAPRLRHSRASSRRTSPIRVGLVALAHVVVIALLATGGPAQASGTRADTGAGSQTYRNPLLADIPDGGVVENCPDPSIIRGQAADDPHWYVYCTMDPLNDDDRDADGDFIFRLMPMLRSLDLVNWTYVGEVFEERPDWVGDTAGLWAPEIIYANGTYYLYYTAQSTQPEIGGGSAIGVATAPSPTGPWTDSGAPVVEPHPDRWIFDPAVIEHDGTRYIYFGSYLGGLWARELTSDGLGSVSGTETQIAIGNRYEAPYLVEHDGYWYMFASATDCCRGPLTGYSVFAARSEDPLGPFVDREGVSVLEGRVGGTPVISMNGNRWVGPGHNAVFTDFDDQDWFLYHAVDRHEPFYADAPGFTKRPLMLDALDWVDGWPTVRGGLWASDTPQPAPAAQPGDRTTYRQRTSRPDRPGPLLQRHSDDFSSATLDSAWTWVREPAAEEYDVREGVFRFDTQAADLHEDSNDASVLTRPAPTGNYVVDTRVRLDVPPDNCCYNFVQAGLVVYGDDDNYVKLVHASIWETRQTEFGKEWAPVPDGWPRYGNTVVGPPGEWTDLRIVKQTRAGEEHYTAYTRRDGDDWLRGGTWTHELGSAARLGLVAMGGEGFTAEFDHIRVHRLHHGSPAPAAGSGT